MASDKIDFTPLPFTGTPSPPSTSFVASAIGFVDVGFFVRQVVNDRVMSIVDIPFTDKSFIRNEGIRTFEGRVQVDGTSTYSSLGAAQTDLTILAQMHGAECTITSAKWGVLNLAICTGLGSPQIRPMKDPAFFIHYNLSFAFQTV